MRISDWSSDVCSSDLPFALRVIDTQNLFVGQAISTVEVVRMVEAGQQNPNKIRERAELIVQNTYGYMVPRDLPYLRVRGQKKGDRSVGWVGAALGPKLDIQIGRASCRERVCQYVSISVGAVSLTTKTPIQ